MTGIRTKAIAAFRERVKNREAMATREFRGDFGVEPDKTSYLGDHWFLFRIDDLHIKGYIEYMCDRLYAKGYHLAAPCPHCEGLIVDKKGFYDLPGLGEAVARLPKMHIMCDTCARARTD